MALINCPECGKQISSKASSCPHCGCPQDEFLKESTPSRDTNAVFPKPIDDSWADEIIKKRKTKVIVCAIFAFSTLGISLLGCLGGYVKRNIHGYTVLAIHNGFTGKLYIENKVYDSGSRDCYATLPDGTNIHVHFSGWDGSPSINIEEPSNLHVGQQNIYVNNTQIENKKIIKKGSKTKNSEMEKILIKNAKIDTLASINPNDTKDAQEKIKIINDLDELND